MTRRIAMFTLLFVSLVLVSSMAFAGDTSIISNSFNGKSSNGDSYNNAISDDGRYVLFSSFASNLVHGTATRRSTCSSSTVQPASPCV